MHLPSFDSASQAGRIRAWNDGELPAIRFGQRGDPRPGFDFCSAVANVCEDVCRRLEELSHIRMEKVLVSVTTNRARSRHGLMARLTPMRFESGSMLTRRRGRLFGIERYFVNGREVLYILTLVLPRLLHRTFEDRLATIIHELYHIGPNFDGDLRRFPGRCAFHSHSKIEYDRCVAGLLDRYLAGHDQPQRLEFLRWNANDFIERHGGLRAHTVPRPRLVPIGQRTPR